MPARQSNTHRNLLLLIVLTATLVIGCKKQSDKPANGGSPQQNTAAADLSEVRLGYFANLTHAQALLGVASGDYANAVAPAKLTTKVFNAGPALMEAIFAGEIDIGYVGP